MAWIAGVFDAAAVATLDEPERRMLATALAGALGRLRRHAAGRAATGTLFGGLLAAGAYGNTRPKASALDSGTAAPSPDPSTVQWASILLGVAACLVVVVVVAAVAVVLIRRTWRSAPPSTRAPVKVRVRIDEAVLGGASFTGRIAGPAVAVSLVCEFFRPGFDYTFSLAAFVGLLACAGFVGMCALATPTVARAVDLVADRRSHVQPLDSLLDSLVPTLASAIEVAPVWQRPDVGRFLIARLEHSARLAERGSWSRSRVPVVEFGLRAHARTTWLQLADVLRAHKRALAAVRSQEAYDSITASLGASVTAMAGGDRDALLAYAPERPPAARFLGRWLSASLLPALLLAACAIVLPQLRVFDANTDAADALRVSLVTCAILTLIPRQGTVIELVVSLLGRISTR